MNCIDLNCDMGEIPAAISDGTQAALMPSFTSINIACGGHAGDAQTMQSTIAQALHCNVAIGAHPGYPDRENFGRLELHLSPQEIAHSICHQLRFLAEIAAPSGATLSHVKPHGALYNQAVHNRDLAKAIATGVGRWNKNVVLVGLAGSPMLEVFREAGFRIAAEAFADRRYEPDGTLRSRKYHDALIQDSIEAANQALAIAQRNQVIAVTGAILPISAQTICIHSDTPNAPQIAAKVAATLRFAGVTVACMSS